MVVADHVPWRAVLRMHAWMLLTVAAITAALVVLDRTGVARLSTPATPFQIVGVALAILIGFRNSASYDRWWEARKLWGGIINHSRTFARQVVGYVEPEFARPVVLRQVAWTHALAAQLRGAPALDAARPWLDAADAEALASARNVPNAILVLQARTLSRLGLAEDRLARIDATLAELSNQQGGCERIRNTPLPVAYRFFTRAFVRGYCILLPFGLLESLGAATMIAVLVMAFIFLVVEAVGGLLQDPFGKGPYGLPLSAMSRTVEIDLRQSIGDADVPPALTPVDYNGLPNLM
jgi:putative membrane protein